MARNDLTERLRTLVSNHGISAVLHSLAEIESSTSLEPQQRKSRSVPKKSLSAAECVNRMYLAPSKTNVIRRAADMFDQKHFLPVLADVKEFARVHGFELPKSVSRASSIQRVFAYIASMDTDAIERILDEGAFSGPSRLGPIADAIRGYSVNRGNYRGTPQDGMRDTTEPKPEQRGS